MKTHFILIIVAVLLGAPAFAALQSDLILDPSGTNPATGQPWQHGDSYRLVFTTSEGHDATSADIDVYNTWATSVADAEPNLTGFSWKVIGSTDTVDARDNTQTNPENIADPDGPIYLIDGVTKVADNNADLWDGDIDHIIDMDEHGGQGYIHLWNFTGTYLDGTKVTDSAGAGTSFNNLGGGNDVNQGNGGSTTQWVWRTWTSAPSTNVLSFYAISEPLYVFDPTMPWPVDAGDSMLSWLDEPLQLNPTVGNTDADTTYYWSAQSFDPNVAVILDPAIDSLDPNTSVAFAPIVTVSQVEGEETTLPVTVVLTLAVNKVGSGINDVTDVMTIDVYEDACTAAQSLGTITFDPSDFNQDCVTDVIDLAEFALTWLNSTGLASPQPK